MCDTNRVGDLGYPVKDVKQEGRTDALSLAFCGDADHVQFNIRLRLPAAKGDNSQTAEGENAVGITPFYNVNPVFIIYMRVQTVP